MRKACTSHGGFSLVELSIVLVILGLLVGGILSGQSLIRASHLRAILTEQERIVTAMQSFRNKFFTRPGDLANAYSFWGASCGANTSAMNTGCNGNGNNRVNYIDGENLKAWEHLALADMISGTYDGTGTAINATTVELSTSNTMKSRFPQAYWDITDHPGGAANVNIPGDDFDFLIIGNPRAAGSGEPNMAAIPSLTHGEAWNIDTKKDDGWANTGKLRGDSNGDCNDAGTDFYAIAATGENFSSDCTLYFILN